MLNALIEFSLKNRFVVLLLAGILVALGVRAAVTPAARRLPRHDAGPGPDQHGRPGAGPGGGRAADHLPGRAGPGRAQRAGGGPLHLEVRAVAGRGDLRATTPTSISPASRSTSGWARSSSREGIERPTMGPVATGLGEVYHYFLSSDVYDLTELRSLQDWVVRPRLRRVPGVAEINSWGGLAKQFEVRADPSKLAKYKLTLDDVIRALRGEQQERRRRLRRPGRRVEPDPGRRPGPLAGGDRQDRHHGPRRRADPRPGRRPRSPSAT